MTAEPTSPQEDSSAVRTTAVRRTVQVGWVCVLLSALFLYLSSTFEARSDGSNLLLWTSSLMAARLCGITSFAIGGIAIYNHRWTEGVVILLLSVGLPVVSFLVHGTF